MLKAEIALRDLSHPPHWQGGVLSIGGSWIRPHVHAALETRFVRTEEQWFLMVRERLATANPYDAAAAETVDADQFQERYRSSLMWPLDYVLIEGAQAGRRMKVRSGVFGVAPLYCRATTDAVSMSWDLADFLTKPLAIDPDIASHFLALGSIYSAQHICAGVTMLTERSLLYVEPGKARYQYPAAVEGSAPSSLESKHEAQEAFAALLHNIVSARPTTGSQVAVELSGGMDSATVASALTNAYGPVASKGILLCGGDRGIQVERRVQIVQRLGLSDDTVDIDAHLPLLDLQPRERKEYPHAELYIEAFDRLWASARAEGCELLFTGVGGDELFPTYQDEATKDIGASGALVEKAREHAGKLLTARARAAVRSLRVFDAPPGPVPVSSLLASTCQAPHMLRHGLWPVNPLSDPRLVAFCHRLPQACRQGRATMRRYLHERLGDDVFPVRYVKETFARVLPELIARHAKSLASQLHECALADLGLVDQRAALALLNEVATTRGDAPTAPLVAFLWLERFVRQLS